MQGGPYDRTVSLREWKPGVDAHPDSFFSIPVQGIRPVMRALHTGRPSCQDSFSRRIGTGSSGMETRGFCPSCSSFVHSLRACPASSRESIPLFSIPVRESVPSCVFFHPPAGGSVPSCVLKYRAAVVIGQFLPTNRDRLFGNSLSRFIGRTPGLMPIPIPFFPFPFRESVPSCVFYMQGGPYDRTVSPDKSGQALRE
jgi:hypothetical protein